jgi:hypothetical protein
MKLYWFIKFRQNFAFNLDDSLKNKMEVKSMEINEEIFRFTEYELKSFLKDEFNKMFPNADYDESENYLFIRNYGKVLVVSHLDVVYEWGKVGGNTDIRIESNRIWSVNGIGGDDRAGVQVLWWLAEHGFKVDYLFTLGEENGCIGAKEFKDRYIGKDLECYAMIEFDRKGDDFVLYQYEDEDWEEYIRKVTGRIKGKGTGSDIKYLSELGVMGVNLGVGYFNNHKGESEYVLIDLMVKAFEDGLKLIKDLEESGRKWKYLRR